MARLRAAAGGLGMPPTPAGPGGRGTTPARAAAAGAMTPSPAVPGRAMTPSLAVAASGGTTRTRGGATVGLGTTPARPMAGDRAMTPTHGAPGGGMTPARAAAGGLGTPPTPAGPSGRGTTLARAAVSARGMTPTLGVTAGQDPTPDGGGRDTRLAWGAGFYRGSQFVAFHGRHGEISNDQVEFALLEHVQSFFAVAGSLDQMPVEVEHHLDRIADERLVINDQNPSLGERRRSLRHNEAKFMRILKNCQY